ncbi:MAG TPA: hypothetical protein VLT79_11635 [Gemmatimonadales bacterium]|nr:hypothetical protein [Gemmatimonadales bacterium]
MSAARRAGLTLGLALGTQTACVYFNAMWSVNHYAGQARSAERAGRSDVARAAWSETAIRAESLVSRHPHSRYVPKALVLQGEGLAASGGCDRAMDPLSRVLATVSATDLRERAALAGAQCSLERGDLVGADSLAGIVVGSSDQARASRAYFLAGRVAELRGDLRVAEHAYAGSTDPEARMSRAHVLLALGAPWDGVLDTLLSSHPSETEWANLLDHVSRTTSAESASAVLNRVLTRTRLGTGSRARLLVADGNRLFAIMAWESAGSRYKTAAGLVPDSVIGHEAVVRGMWVRAVTSRNLTELRAVRSDLLSLIPSLDGGSTQLARSLDGVLSRVILDDDATDVARLQAAEVARDSMHALELAGTMFLDLARDRPNSLFAPKALLAAAPLRPDVRDSIFDVLAVTYAASPYTLAWQGEQSPAYAAAEDSLAIALGGKAPELPLAVGVPVPVPGRRGPPLDSLGEARPSADAVTGPTANPVRAGDAKPGRKRGAQPPVDRQ